ncbi:MAG: TIGR02466 family protein [Pseudomonadota bacterium]
MTEPAAQTRETRRPEPLGRRIEDCVQMVFPTPIAVHRWDDSDALNAALTALVLAEEARGEGLARSNVGGWHSEMTFIMREEPPFLQLMDRIRTMVGALTGAMMKPAQHRFRIEGWANVLRTGQYNSIHLHPNSTWSGVYYVTGNPPPEGAGDPEYSGKIEFIDPRPGASATYSVENAMQRRCMLNPGPGTMIVFPSWMQHQVHPYFGPRERISIAFNVVVA